MFSGLCTDYYSCGGMFSSFKELLQSFYKHSLATSLATVVSETVRQADQNTGFDNFACKCFLVFKTIFDVEILAFIYRWLL